MLLFANLEKYDTVLEPGNAVYKVYKTEMCNSNQLESQHLL